MKNILAITMIMAIISLFVYNAIKVSINYNDIDSIESSLTPIRNKLEADSKIGIHFNNAIDSNGLYFKIQSALVPSIVVKNTTPDTLLIISLQKQLPSETIYDSLLFNPIAISNIHLKFRFTLVKKK